MDSLGTTMGPEQANQAALSLAEGLGSGSASALKLKSKENSAYNSTGVNEIAGNFGQGKRNIC